MKDINVKRKPFYVCLVQPKHVDGWNIIIKCCVLSFCLILMYCIDTTEVIWMKITCLYVTVVTPSTVKSIWCRWHVKWILATQQWTEAHRGKTQLQGGKLESLILFWPQIQHGEVLDINRDLDAKSRPITAYNMARPQEGIVSTNVCNVGKNYS
jgi:hypothetical protein